MMAAPTYQDCPILVWMISLNRNYSQEVSITLTPESSILTLDQEYDECYTLVKDCVANVNIEYNPTDPDSFRALFLRSLLQPSLLTLNRQSPLSNAPIAHDAPSTNTEIKVARL